MQLIAGRTGQEYNQRKARRGAFWEDRYHVTAIKDDEHLHRCVVYIDLNMVHAGVERHPAAWAHGGYRAIHNPRERYTLINLNELSLSCGFTRFTDFQKAHRQWVEEAPKEDAMTRDERWSEALAVASEAFVEKVKRELTMKALHRDIDGSQDSYVLRERPIAYKCRFRSENDVLSQKNLRFWRENRLHATT